MTYGKRMAMLGVAGAGAAMAVLAPQCAAAQDRPTTQWLLGTWSDRKDCGQPLTLVASGDFHVIGGKGRWRFEGDELVLIAGSKEQRVRIRKTGPDTLVMVQNGVTSYRCWARGQ